MRTVRLMPWLVSALSAVTLLAADPVVSGPVAAQTTPPDPAHDYPFFAALEDLKSRGYVEEEYFFSGTANRYETPEGASERVLDRNHNSPPRLLVRRPADGSRFNGTVV